MFNFKEFFGSGKKSEAKTLKQLFKLGWISEEEFLRFMVVKKGISLTQAEAELKRFLTRELKRKK